MEYDVSLTRSPPQGTLFTAVILCMDDDLLLPPRDAPVGELVTVKNHPPTPSRNGQAVSVVWEKVLNDELLQVGHDEVISFCFFRAPTNLVPVFFCSNAKKIR